MRWRPDATETIINELKELPAELDERKFESLTKLAKWRRRCENRAFLIRPLPLFPVSPKKKSANCECCGNHACMIQRQGDRYGWKSRI